MQPEASIRRIFVSPGHNFFGHYGQSPGAHPSVAVTSVECLAGKGLRGDRFFDFKPQKFLQGYDGQVTFFAWETYEDLCQQLDVWDRDVAVFRRNVVTAGIDLNTWIGHEFEIQGVRFFGVKECSPCEWMDSAFAPGALSKLKGRGGLRARILCDGVLRVSI